MRDFLRRFAINYLKTLAVIAVLITSMMATYMVINRERIFPAKDSIVVYGRDTCGYTSALREELEEQGIEYSYGDIDLIFPDIELTAHLDLAEPRAVRLPVVVVGGQVLERPNTDEVIQLKARK